ncbi:MAG: NADPH-dependent 2,4-dienoyl-CoA reductase/sulfur reductase-like enzyme [Candidatus Azotimanducaceae bacterium]|jgi:NADPH-dependent 2,4-dienoyl-CoA reductase/sulfur reductase-like enzyme
MSRSISRRELLKNLSALGLAGLLSPTVLASSQSAKLVVVGGGFGGATVARFAKRLLPTLQVSLVEPAKIYVACPFSNLVIGGLRSLNAQMFSYGALTAEGINVLPEMAIDVDPVARQVKLSNKAVLDYDKLVLSPGIDFRWGALEGYKADAVNTMPHAWKAGAQTEILKAQLQSMPDGGVVAISVTAAPFRCPPGPYERASIIGNYLKQHKPKSKLLVLDSNEKFSKQPLFLSAWEKHYGNLIEWRNPSNDGRVNRVDVKTMTLHTDFDSLKADVVNIVPPQQAGLIAQRAGVANESGWCPINAENFESPLQVGIHVIGDATIAAPMPKSAFAANAQAKVCAIQIVRMLSELEVEPTTLANTCYSFVTENKAISVSGVYHNQGGVLASVPGAGGISPRQAPDDLLMREAVQARDWFETITTETFL